MKIKKIFIFLLMAMPTLVLQSCLKDDKDVFDESSATRLQNYLTNTQNTLTGSEYGWAFDYYPDRDQQYGGFSYAVKFNPDSAIVSCELANPTRTATSLYTMTTDNGPVLSFDTYNTFLHFFATPSSDRYEAYDGDFEFTVQEVTADRIKLKGVRSGNTMYMYRLTKPADQYLIDVENMENEFILSTAQGTLGVSGQQVNVSFDLDNRQAEVIVGTDTTETAFNYSDKGIRFYHPIEAGGQSEYDFTFDPTTLALTGVNDPSIVLNGSISAAAMVQLLGGTISGNDDALTRTLTVPHLSDFTFKSNDDWATVTTDGNNLTLSATPNTTGDMRSTTITITDGSGNSAELTIAQCDVDKDIVGDYYVAFYNSQNTPTFVDGTIAKAGNNDYTLSFTLFPGDNYEMNIVAHLTWDATTNTFNWECGQDLCTTLRGMYHVFNIFLDAQAQYWTGYTVGGYFATLAMQHDNENGTYALLGGSFAGIDIGTIFLGANSGTTLSSSNYAGYIESMTNFQIQKKTAESSAKKKIVKK